MAQQPFLYYDPRGHDERFPFKPFDPKAVTRASLIPKPERPKQEGPFLNFNRHPDEIAAASNRRSNYVLMGPRDKRWIKWMRKVQLGWRILEINGAVGIIALMILFTKVESTTGLLLRVAPAIAIFHTGYGIYHLARPAAGRTPTSSYAYHVFSAIADICVAPIYAFGALAIKNDSANWNIRLDNPELLSPLLSATYYMFIAAGSLHLVSFLIGVWLAWMFRKITRMPPDMNPLEDNLTSRLRRKKNLSTLSAATYESHPRVSMAIETNGRSTLSTTELPRPLSMPFLSTRSSSQNGVIPQLSETLISTPTPAQHASNLRRTEGQAASKRASRALGSYQELAATQTTEGADRMETTKSDEGRRVPALVGKFTETWKPTQSLIARTKKRNNHSDRSRGHEREPKSYTALSQQCQQDESSDSDCENSWIKRNSATPSSPERRLSRHPHPLESHPTATPPSSPSKTRKSILKTSSPKRESTPTINLVETASAALSMQFSPPKRDNSIQKENKFYSKPYGDLKPATPPIMVGSDRQVSSGNDFEAKGKWAYFRRHVSGKVAEEGRAGMSGNSS